MAAGYDYTNGQMTNQLYIYEMDKMWIEQTYA